MQLQGNLGSFIKQGFNGTLQIQLARASAMNTCTTPASMVGNSPTNIPVVNGVLQGTGYNFVPTYCLSPSVSYYVQLLDKSYRTIFTDNWYLTYPSGGIIDVGSMVKSNFGGPVVVAVPSPIIASPSASQSITQPAGTSFTFYGNVNFAGSTTGVTASSFTVTPTQCTGSNSFATGIQSNGNANCSSPSSGVTSFNGRTGTVTPQSGDYTYSQIVGTPSIWFQQNYFGGTLQSQTNGYDFSSAFNISSESSPAVLTTVDLHNFGVGGTYGTPSSVTLDNYGRVTSVTAQSNPCGASLGTGCSYLPGGLMIEWGITSGLSGGGGSTTVSFPVPYTSAIYSATATTFGSTDRITYISNVSTSGMTVNNNGSSAEAYWITIGK